MRIIEIANNGQIIQSVMTLNELTEGEKQSVRLIEGEKLTDYSEFWVHYNIKRTARQSSNT